jgi:hypothetical protein
MLRGSDHGSKASAFKLGKKRLRHIVYIINYIPLYKLGQALSLLCKRDVYPAGLSVLVDS